MDEPGWQDAEGDTCDTYFAQSFCTHTGAPGPLWTQSWGDLSQFAVQGRSAREACCTCGGGTTIACTDAPGWTDAEGDTCLEYEQGRWCAADGRPGTGWPQDWGTLAAFGSAKGDATTACCACGGGTRDGGTGAAHTGAAGTVGAAGARTGDPAGTVGAPAPAASGGVSTTVLVLAGVGICGALCFCLRKRGGSFDSLQEDEFDRPVGRSNYY